MKRIYIIRHAKSSWDYPELNDMVRPLSERGKADVQKIGKYLSEHQIFPDCIICSPATRALHTCIEIANYTKYSIDKIDIQANIYFENCKSIKKYINKINNQNNTIFIFGHEPTLSALIQLLSEVEVEKFPTCAVFGIEFDTDDWKKIEKGKSSIFIYPKLL